MSFKIEITESADSVEEMAEALEHIAGLLRDGMTSGYHPGWTLVGMDS